MNKSVRVAERLWVLIRFRPARVAVWFGHFGGYRAPPLVKIIAVGFRMSNKFLHRCLKL